MDGAISDSGNTRLVGFSLAESSVSLQDVRSGSDFMYRIYVPYVMSTVVLYTACVMTIFFWYQKLTRRSYQITNLIA